VFLDRANKIKGGLDPEDTLSEDPTLRECIYRPKLLPLVFQPFMAVNLLLIIIHLPLP
jgi:hypothetical protein